MKILVINPGSTSTKIAVYENETPLLVRNISHTVEELSVYSQVVDQFEFRKNLVLQELEANKIPFDFDAVIGRGGLVKPIPGGVYEVNEAMKRDTVHAMRTHACNLGGLIADKLASSLPNCRAFIADPGVVDTGMITMHKWFDPLADALFRPFIKAADRGALSSFNAICSDERQGCLFKEKKKTPMPAFDYSSGLWDETEEVLARRFGVNLPKL